MTTLRFGMTVLTGVTMLASLGGVAKGQSSVAELLARKPVQQGVKVTTPTAADAATFKAVPISYPGQPTVSGTAVKDASGKVVRQVIVIAGQKKQQIVTYYLDGVEAYREIDQNGTGTPDIFRWLGPNGGKMGRDLNGDGSIDAWDILSAEEASQELFEAIASNNTARFQALLVNEKDIASLGLPAAEAVKIKTRVGAATNRFHAAVKKYSLTPQAKWAQLGTLVPFTTPADAVGGQFDIVRQKLATILVEKAKDKFDMIPTGEMIQVGRVWKLIDGPGDEAGATSPEALDPRLRPLLDELAKIQPPAPGVSSTEVLKYHVDRYTILEKVVAATQGAEQEPWIQQLIDALAAAAEAAPPGNDHYKRLVAWTDQIEKADPKGANAAYARFRQISAEYASKLVGIKQIDVNKVQEWWREQLEGYLKSYGTAADAPDAMLRLAIAYEFAKDGEAKAIEWSDKLVSTFPQHAFAAKARGIVARLKSEGQTFVLAGPTLGTNQSFDIASLKGKPVLVAYWASWAGRVKEDAKQLNDLAKEYGPKGLAIVTVCLDDNAQVAAQAQAAYKMPGIVLHQPGGVDGNPLAVQYGVMGPHAFLIGKDGKVVNKAAQLGVVGDEIDKLLK
ncbi:MAG TPA: TlpA disulfide reductase family protein [Fimbriiglobus sp.]|jgi:thiol-disulfide isomerase/thioredoxin